MITLTKYLYIIQKSGAKIQLDLISFKVETDKRRLLKVECIEKRKKEEGVFRV